MKTTGKINSIGMTVGLTVIFIGLISWTTDFRFLKLQDIRMIAIILISTTILILLGQDENIDYPRLLDKFRFNLFFTGMLMSLFLMLSYLSGSLEYKNILNKIILCLKPMLFCLLIYLPGMNILGRVVSNNIDKTLAISESSLDLTRREREVFDLAVVGLSNKEISEKLFIAETTVKKHMQNILKKASCSNREELIKRFTKESINVTMIN
ncbi:helix-turn-helix transcriptional regulator [Wukongibacter baidiensis]|uniref:response regulator transcription factor n=1 Tax=Wukongibacter baidiensis TaxID=1723361 RepID=UPI003D7F3B62